MSINLHIDILSLIASYLHENDLIIIKTNIYTTINITISNYIIACGHLNLLKLIWNNIEHNEDVCDIAAGNGQIEVLKWVLANNYPLSGWLSAVKNDHLEVLQWFQENDVHYTISRYICSHAAKYGRLNILIWARKTGYYWDENTCTNAAANGHLDVLKWARANGCEWSNTTSLFAGLHRRFNILKWLIDNGCPWRNMHMDEQYYPYIITWLQENGYL